MKYMFISKELNLTSGAGVGARMHRDTLINLVGADNVFIVDVSVQAAPLKKENYIAYGKYKNPFERIIRHIQGNVYLFSDNIIEDICSVIESQNINFVFVDDSFFGRLVKKIKTKFPRLPVVSFFHDVKAELFAIWIKRSCFIDKIDFMIGIKNEAINVKYTDKNIVLNQREDELLFKHYNIHSDFYLPVCVDRNDCYIEKKPEDPYKETGKKHILFVGTSYYPNIEGIKWFYINVFKYVRQYYDLYIVGKGLECLKDYFDDDDVYVIGFCEDLSSFYIYSDIVIAPLTDGGGMKIKTAEAFSYGKVFLGSNESLQGYYEKLDLYKENTIKEKLIFLCDTAKRYKEVLEMLKDTDVKKENPEIIDIFEEHFSPRAAKVYMKNIIDFAINDMQTPNK